MEVLPAERRNGRGLDHSIPSNRPIDETDHDDYRDERMVKNPVQSRLENIAERKIEQSFEIIHI